jgi:non-specific serine/threonine protein kinase
MPKLTKELLDEERLRKAVDSETFKLGHYIFQQRLVKVLETSEHEAICQVHDKRAYTVKLIVSTSYLYFKCTCSHASRGLVCEHDVAAWLCLGEYLARQEPPAWRNQLSKMLGAVQSAPRPPQTEAYILLFSLQEQYQSILTNWLLAPYYLPLKALPDELAQNPGADAIQQAIQAQPNLARKLKHAYSALDLHGCANGAQQGVLLANLMIDRNRYNYGTLSTLLHEYLPLVANSGLPLFLGTAQEPLQKAVRVMPSAGELRIRINRDEGGLHILPQIFLEGNAIDTTEIVLDIICSNPLWILAGDLLFEVVNQAGSDLVLELIQTPELVIPPDQETDFLERYLLEMARLLPLEGNAVEWQELGISPIPRLYLSDVEGEFQAQLRFAYQEFELKFNPDFPAQSLRRAPDSWSLTRIQRDTAAERAASELLGSGNFGLKRIPPTKGASNQAGSYRLRARKHPVDFLLNTLPHLIEHGFEIFGEEQLVSARVNRNTPTISFNISSGIDWFDVQTVISFGEIEVAMKEIRRAMRKRERYIKLADGSIGEIPEQWFDQYKHLFALGEENEQGLRLSRHHIGLIEEVLSDASTVSVDSEYERRKAIFHPLIDPDFQGITAHPLPCDFKGELRPYQKSGYDWLHFLRNYEFGGCLADDMGLGKTIQALAFLQSIYCQAENPKETDPQDGLPASLLVVPRSLLINWQREAARFTPDLRVMEYFDTNRSKDLEVFNQADLIITTYGVMLRDITLLHSYNFHYVILDESQAIKNALSQTARAARLLQAQHRLVLTGTPIENSTVELWSQFTFLNPGLLGSLEYFRNEFGAPIERKNDEKAAQMLRKLVYPFILRRTKDQVAPELPPRTERILYSDMEPAQRKVYNRTRDYFRGMLLGMIDKEGINNSRMKILEGLLRLRQISNHPMLVDSQTRAESGKFELLFDTLETLHSEGHKALVFSQFVQMLRLVRQELEKRQIPYTYLDGHTQNRQEVVDVFQNQPEIPFFLISLKAGGLGLNLTAADYVIHIDPWWNPAVEMQATDRTHRIGQEKPVFIFKLITRDSVEEKILLLQERKKALVDQLITTESTFFKELTREDVQVLFS